MGASTVSSCSTGFSYDNYCGDCRSCYHATPGPAGDLAAAGAFDFFTLELGEVGGKLVPDFLRHIME